MTVKDDLHLLVDELDEDAARKALARETSLTTRQLDALTT